LVVNESFISVPNRIILVIVKKGKISMIIENVNIGLLIELDLTIAKNGL